MICEGFVVQGSVFLAVMICLCYMYFFIKNHFIRYLHVEGQIL